MLDLLVAAEVVRKKTAQSLEADVPKGKAEKLIRPRRGAFRSNSAAALRGLADLIEPSRPGAVSG
jgi:hypothetical protein